jgi:hypothetical protein
VWVGYILELIPWLTILIFSSKERRT